MMKGPRQGSKVLVQTSNELGCLADVLDILSTVSNMSLDRRWLGISSKLMDDRSIQFKENVVAPRFQMRANEGLSRGARLELVDHCIEGCKVSWNGKK